MSGITCEYVSIVSVIEAWPSRSLTIFGFSDFHLQRVATWRKYGASHTGEVFRAIPLAEESA